MKFTQFTQFALFTQLLMRSLVTAHTTSLYVMPEVLNRASSVFLSRKHSGPVKPGNDKNVALLMNSLVIE